MCWGSVCAAVSLLSVALSGCGGPSTPSAPVVLGNYLRDWSARQWTAMAQLVDQPPADFVTVNAAAFTNLGISTASFTSAPMVVNAQTATAVVTEHLQVGTLGVWAPTTTVTLVKRAGRWLVSWTPQTINPSLISGSHLALTRTWAARAAILGAGGTALAAPQAVVEVGIEGSRVKNAAMLTSVLVAAGATPTEVSTALTAAAAHPSFFEQVFQITEARYNQLGGVNSALYTVPGTVFEHTAVRGAITPELAAHVVGSVGPITAQELEQLGSNYDSTDTVGQNGIEAAYERQLAGTPGGTVIVVDSAGKTTATLDSFLPKAGTAVTTSIDRTDQEAAEAAMAGVPGKSAMVAVNATTGQVLATVSNPVSEAFDQALNGQFAPGSTFKVIDSTALFEAGLTPSSPAACPPALTVNGQVFHNAEGDGMASNVEQAFAESCNTAFIGLVGSHLSAATLQAAVAAYDLGTTPEIGLDAVAASVPIGPGANGLAATAIGQGQVLLSPLNLARVAAAVDTGTVRQPRLVDGAAGDTAPTHALPAVVVAPLQQMMAAVVASGTAAGTGLPAGTHAKTGTAEYGTGTPQPTDAWLMGYDGNVAFAIVVQGTGNGGPTDGPIIAKFLAALGSSA
jgi:cell division protein FtsI/penicillin-binding protein 2